MEHLITKLLQAWDGKEDIYLVGCTNVGKSTLFNSLLQSDLCAIRENDLIQRATTSVWPGTTLSLLKFPIAKLEGWQKHKRDLRLRYEEKVKAAEFQFRQSLYRQTGNAAKAQIIDRIGMTFRQDVPFTTDSLHPFARRSVAPVPFDENETYKYSRFLFDTPGTVYKHQLLSMLTTEELLKTVPRSLITPRSFRLQPFQTLFVAGLGRLDVVHSRQNVILTVSASKYLPIHVVHTREAQHFYDFFLGSELLAVPCGSEERLKQFPALLPQELDLQGINWTISSLDGAACSRRRLDTDVSWSPCCRSLRPHSAPVFSQVNSSDCLTTPMVRSPPSTRSRAKRKDRRRGRKLGVCLDASGVLIVTDRGLDLRDPGQEGREIGQNSVRRQEKGSTRS